MELVFKEMMATIQRNEPELVREQYAQPQTHNRAAAGGKNANTEDYLKIFLDSRVAIQIKDKKSLGDFPRRQRERLPQGN